MTDPWYGSLVPRPKLTRSLVHAFVAIDPNFLPPIPRISERVLWDYEAYKADALRRGEQRRPGAKAWSYR